MSVVYHNFKSSKVKIHNNKIHYGSARKNTAKQSVDTYFQKTNVQNFLKVNLISIMPNVESFQQEGLM